MTTAPRRVVALIPARGGSKGLPGKNIKLLAGKPMIGYTIEAAKACKAIDAVYVSTNDLEIEQVAGSFGVDRMPLRPSVLATDEASSLDVIRHFLDWIAAETDSCPEHLVLLQPTSPLRGAEELEAALTQYAALPVGSSLVSVVPTKPPTWQGGLNADGTFTPGAGWDPNKNRQMLGANYALNGAIYCAPVEKVYRSGFMEASVYPFVMGSSVSIDIDTAEDFLMAEALLLYRQGAGLSPCP